MEMCGPGLVEAIDAHRPAMSVHGHVHQPIARRLRRGRTECVNVGHFQRYPTPFEVDLR
jgi:Icc-related predicted phosphoesterase